MTKHFFNFLIIYLFVSFSFSQNYADKNFYLVDSLNLNQIEVSELKLIDSCLTQFHSSKNDSIKISLINHLIENSYNNHVWPKYNEWIYNKTSQELSKKKDQFYHKYKAGAINNFGYLSQIQGHSQEAISNYTRSINIYQKINDSIGVANALNNIGSVYYYDNKPIKSLKHYHESLNIRILTKDTFGIANSYNNIGNIYREEKNSSEALEYFLKSLQLRKIIGNKQLSPLYQNIGLCYLDLNNFKKAEKQFIRAYKKDSLNNDSYGAGHSLLSLGLSYEKQDLLKQALKNYKKSFYFFKKEKNDKYTAYALISIARTKTTLNHPIKAVEVDFTNAISLFKKVNHVDGVGKSHEGLAKLYLKHNQIPKAFSHANIFLEVGKGKNNNTFTKDAYELFSSINEKQRNYKDALVFHQKAMKLDNQISKDIALSIQEIKLLKNQSEQELFLKQKELQHQLNLSQTKNESQQRAIIISVIALGVISILSVILLKKLSTNKKQQNKLNDMYLLVQKSSDEKTTLLKEIHHRVKNNLQVVSSLLRLQERNSNKPETVEVLKESRTRVNSMALVHEMLYQVDDLSLINYNEYIQLLCEKLINSYKNNNIKIEFVFTSPKLKISIENAIPLGLLLNEIISNSIKHAFINQKKGIIYLYINEVNDNSYKLKIGDNGSGSSLSLEDKTNSLGLKLIQKMVKQLNGSIEKISQEQGTHYIITFENT